MTKTNFATGQLRSYIDRVLRLKAEQDDLGVDIREVYKEAHSAGFDKTILGQVVQRIRKEEKNGSERLAETDAMVDLYLSAYRGEQEDGEGNHTSGTVEPAQRPPLPREKASSAHTRTHVRASEPIETTNSAPPTSCGEVDQAGEGAAAAKPSPADHSYDPMTGELDPGPMPAFLKRKGAKVAA